MKPSATWPGATASAREITEQPLCGLDVYSLCTDQNKGAAYKSFGSSPITIPVLVHLLPLTFAVALAPFRDGNIFSAKFAGEGAWERHPNGDELVQIVDGSATLHIVRADGPTAFAVSAGTGWFEFE